ncbi:serine hydrolase domain-containing protein [Chitinophaga vietnamensis]|uniref:serine hydrolase domain-containing protein n=1 Tax=Chitinophaga vietnamensis TaxID=2593957 RepID=UPI00137613B5|nr:serine hydrolase domain-containing protein [Chitinophaga vietnamensis]
MKQSGLASLALLTPQLSYAFAGASERKFTQLRKAIASHAATLKIPGLVAAVVEDGQVTFLQTEGFADLDLKIPVSRNHIFPVASLTKTFAAVTLMKYEQEGKISMDDYILDYPFFPVGLTPDRLQTPNIKIKHVLSHTSEGVPGSNYIYNGNRYSFVYGVFEKMSGNTRHYEAFADELNKHILRPLAMKNTFPGYPNKVIAPASVVTAYSWDRELQKFNPDKGLQNATILFPATNLFTTLDDLVAYSSALDSNTILTADHYTKLTTPFVTNSGRENPYGLGWATQRIANRHVHWHYGYGDSYAALIIRIPKEKKAFILLSNSAAASAPFFLGYGNLLSSPFAVAFFKHFINEQDTMFSYNDLVRNKSRVQNPLLFDEVLSQALMRYYAEQNYHENKGEALALMQYLAQNDPSGFQRIDGSLIYLLEKLGNQELKAQMEAAINAYAASDYFHPEIHDGIARWFDHSGNKEAARLWYHKLADSKWYGEQWPVRNACTELGKYYLGQGEKEKGRSYLWQEALYAPDDAARQVTLMNSFK